MWFRKGPNPNKAAKLEKKGDRLAARGKFQKALKFYQKSEVLAPDRPEIYQKLHETFQKIDREWTQEDFEISMTWTMRQQELEHPEVKQVYEKFTPEYQEAQRLFQRLMISQDQEEEARIITEILEFGETGQMAAIDFILSIKKIAQGPPAPEPPEPES